MIKSGIFFFQNRQTSLAYKQTSRQ